MGRVEDKENRKKISRILIGTGAIALVAVGFLLYFWKNIAVDIPRSNNLSFQVVAEGSGPGETAQILVFRDLDTVCLRIVSGSTGSSHGMHCWAISDAPTGITRALSDHGRAGTAPRGTGGS